MTTFSLKKLSVVALTTLTLTGALTASASAQVDPAGCPQDVTFDPAVRTWSQVFPNSPIAGNNSTGSSQKHLTADLYTYAQAVMADVAQSSRVRIVEKDIGATVLGRRLKYYAIGTPDNIANLDAGATTARSGAAWSRGQISDRATAWRPSRSRPAFAWITATPHGDEPAAGEAISRELYELPRGPTAHNARRLQNLTCSSTRHATRTAATRTAARRRGALTPTATSARATSRRTALHAGDRTSTRACSSSTPTSRARAYFFPPNEDPVHHEISQFALDFIQDTIGPALQQAFNDQSDRLPELQPLRPVHAGVRRHRPGAARWARRA